MEERRPGIASASRGRKGAFSSLVEHAVQDPDTLDALLFAYELLPIAARLQMVEAIVHDAPSPGPALASLLSVETEPGLRAHLGERLRHHSSVDVAFVSGDDACGEAFLPDVDEEGRSESLRLTWDDAEITSVEIVLHAPGALGPAMSRTEAMARLAPMLWRHLRRGGTVPLGVERFARAF